MPRQKSILRIVIEPLAVAVVLACAVRATLSLYTIPSASMRPTLETGDHIIVTPYRGTMPARGDIIVFRAPDHPAEFRVKRVIALPGDFLDTTAGRVRIGGHALSEPYLLKQSETGSIPPQLVPAQSLFVMGDNRADSVDSRNWGALPSELVMGRVRMVLWSSPGGGESVAGAATRSGARSAGVRFKLSRIFKCVE